MLPHDPLERAYVRAIALAIACLFFASQTDRFLTGENLSLVLQQVMVVGVIAIGQTLIVLTAGIDLSCGMVMALGGIVMTKLAVEMGVPVPLAILAGIGVTALFGLINGLLVTRLKFNPFIALLISSLALGAAVVTVGTGAPGLGMTHPKGRLARPTAAPARVK